MNRTFVHVCHKMKWVAVGSSLLDNEPLKLHDYLFIVGGKTLGQRCFLPQRQAISLHKPLTPMVGSLKLSSRNLVLWIFGNFKGTFEIKAYAHTFSATRAFLLCLKIIITIFVIAAMLLKFCGLILPLV